jgi:hypothetical protein
MLNHRGRKPSLQDSLAREAQHDRAQRHGFGYRSFMWDGWEAKHGCLQRLQAGRASFQQGIRQELGNQSPSRTNAEHHRLQRCSMPRDGI